MMSARLVPFKVSAESLPTIVALPLAQRKIGSQSGALAPFASAVVRLTGVTAFAAVT